VRSIKSVVFHYLYGRRNFLKMLDLLFYPFVNAQWHITDFTYFIDTGATLFIQQCFNPSL